MDVDQVLKIILILSISICLIAFTYFIAKLIREVTLLLRSTRKVADDAAEISGTINKVVNKFTSPLLGNGEGGALNAIVDLAVKGGVLGGVFAALQSKLGGNKKGEKEDGTDK